MFRSLLMLPFFSVCSLPSGTICEIFPSLIAGQNNEAWNRSENVLAFGLSFFGFCVFHLKISSSSSSSSPSCLIPCYSNSQKICVTRRFLFLVIFVFVVCENYDEFCFAVYACDARSSLCLGHAGERFVRLNIKLRKLFLFCNQKCVDMLTCRVQLKQIQLAIRENWHFESSRFFLFNFLCLHLQKEKRKYTRRREKSDEISFGFVSTTINVLLNK